VTIKNTISVVCPTYNSELFLEKTLGALLRQTEPADEVIFSDDGSTDCTIDILGKWKSRLEDKGSVVVIIKNQHQGPGASRNAGIRQAKSEWISFLDSDDLWKPEKIVRIKESIKACPKKNVFLHGEEYVRLNGNKILIMHGKNYKEDKSLSKQLYRGCFFSTSATTLHKSILSNGMFDTTLPNGQDYELWLRLSPYMNLQVIPEVLGEYIEQSNSITARPYYKRYLSQIRILSRHYRKGGILLAIYMIARVTLSKQWAYMVLQWITGIKKHAW